MQQRARQLECRRVAHLGQFGQRRATGVSQAQQLGGFVKRFTGGIVNGFTQNLVAPYPVDPHQLGVPARHQQGHKWKFGWVST